MAEHGIVYEARSRTTGKRYFGQTRKGIEKRRSSHLRRCRGKARTCPRFHAALRSHGLDDFEWRVCWEGPTERLNAVETGYIAFYDSTNTERGYNLAKFGDAPLRDRECSAETRAKLSAANKGKKQSREQIDKAANANRGRRRTPEQCARISAGKTGKRKTHCKYGHKYSGVSKNGSGLCRQCRQATVRAWRARQRERA